MVCHARLWHQDEDLKLLRVCQIYPSQPRALRNSPSRVRTTDIADNARA